MQQRELSFQFLKPAGETTAPQWSEGLFPAEALASLRMNFADGQRVAIRVPLTLEMKDGAKNATYFDAFLEPAPSLGKGEDYFVREGMTISQISTLTGARGVRGLVLVDHEHLSSLLGDSEGPAHTKWGENESRPGERYEKWVSRLRFVKHSLAKLVQYLSPPPEKLEFDLLQDIFSIDDPSKVGHSKKRGKLPKDGDGFCVEHRLIRVAEVVRGTKPCVLRQPIAAVDLGDFLGVQPLAQNAAEFVGQAFGRRVIPRDPLAEVGIAQINQPLNEGIDRIEAGDQLVPDVARVFDGVKVRLVAGHHVVIVAEFRVEIGVDPCDGISRDSAGIVGRAFRGDVEFDRFRFKLFPQWDEKSALDEYDELRREIVSFDEILHEIVSEDWCVVFCHGRGRIIC